MHTTAQQPEPSAFFRPDYAQDFRCIASACEDTCCQGWSVPIDQATYAKYSTLHQMKPHLGTLIVLNTSNPTLADYARIPLGDSASCAFLDAERLCGIQKRLGAEALSHTCATYPRAASSVAGMREEALNLSCPEAARLTLLNPHLLAAPNISAPRPQAHEGRLAIRHFTLRTLADRTHPLWHRLHRLGVIARRMDTLRGKMTPGAWADANANLIPHLLSESGEIPALPLQIPQPAQQLQFVMEALRLRIVEPPVPTRFLDCVRDFEAGLGCATAHTESEILEAYRRGHRLHLKPLLQRHPHLLENYLANAVLKTGYPFGVGREEGRHSAAAEHLLLCLQTAILQTMLIGVASHYRESFAPAHVVKVVQSFARTFEHSRRALDQLRELAGSRGLNTLPGIALLLQLEPLRHAANLPRPTPKVAPPTPVPLPPLHVLRKFPPQRAYRAS
jgi:lysine-N-methylase